MVLERTSLYFYNELGVETAQLLLYAPKGKTDALIELTAAQAKDMGEERIQLLEGSRYEYQVDGNGASTLRLEEAFGRGLVEASNILKLAHCGSIATGINTGRLALLAKDADGTAIGRAAGFPGPGLHGSEVFSARAAGFGNPARSRPDSAAGRLLQFKPDRWRGGD